MATSHEITPICPFCNAGLEVGVLCCQGCGTELRGRFILPALARLPKTLQDFAIVFLRHRGNFKEVERELDISYPTVSKKLDAVNVILGAIESPDAAKTRILRQLEAGEVTVAQAIEMIRGLDAPEPPDKQGEERET